MFKERKKNEIRSSSWLMGLFEKKKQKKKIIIFYWWITMLDF